MIDNNHKIYYLLLLILLLLFFLTPVDPAGPDCYQSGTKPCEST